MVMFAKKAIELLDAVTSVHYSRKGLGYTIGRDLDAVLYLSPATPTGSLATLTREEN
jgi:hypothetical protein